MTELEQELKRIVDEMGENQVKAFKEQFASLAVENRLSFCLSTIEAFQRLADELVIELTETK